MDKEICLDTDVCIEIVKETSLGRRILEDIDEKQINIPVAVIFELYLRETHIDKVDFFLSKFNPLPFEEQTAKIASSIHKQLKKQGNILDLRDLFIAATCIEHGYCLLTLNKKHFDRVQGLELMEI